MIEIREVAPSDTTKYLSNVYSQFGEDGLLREVFRRIGTTNKQCFEVGAADGRWFSNSRNLIDQGWKAVLIEADPSNWPTLDKLEGPNVQVVHGKAEPSGPCSLDCILEQCKCEAHMDLGIIDVDGQDYYLWNGMMRHAPRVMVVEYDYGVEKNFVPELNGKGQAGFAAICSVAISGGYFNAFTTQTNAIFILNSERDKFYAGDKERLQSPALSETTVVEAIPEESTKDIKIAAILGRPRFGLNDFWDCASEGLAPWHIPLQSFKGVFWGQCMQRAFEKNIETGVDWILTLDYDTMFNAGHVSRLIDALGKNPHIDAIAGLQARRGRPLPLMVHTTGEARMDGKPVKAATAHFGLTILRTEAIKKMKKPWFLGVPDADGSWGEGRFDEDIYFWHRWKEAGNSLYVHSGCKIGHMEEMVAVYNDRYEVEHKYLTKWRQENGQRVEAFE